MVRENMEERLSRIGVLVIAEAVLASLFHGVFCTRLNVLALVFLANKSLLTHFALY